MQTKKIIAFLIVILGLLPVPTMVMAADDGDVEAAEDADNALQAEIAAADEEATAAEAAADTAAVELADADAFVVQATTAHGAHISDPELVGLRDARAMLSDAQANEQLLMQNADSLQAEYDALPRAWNPVGAQAKINKAKKAELTKVREEIKKISKETGDNKAAVALTEKKLEPLIAKEQVLSSQIDDAQAIQQQRQMDRNESLAKLNAAKARAQQAREAVANRQARIRPSSRVTSQPTELTRVKNIVNDGPTVQDAISTTTPRSSITARPVRSKAAQARSKAAQKNRAVTPKRKSRVIQSTEVDVMTTE